MINQINDKDYVDAFHIFRSIYKTLNSSFSKFHKVIEYFLLAKIVHHICISQMIITTLVTIFCKILFWFITVFIKVSKISWKFAVIVFPQDQLKMIKSKLLKVGLAPFQKCFICFNESPLKMMKNAYFKFLSWFFDNVEKIAWLEI